LLLGYRGEALIVEALSLLTALCYGVSAVLNRIGMRDSNPMTGAMVISLVQVLILSVLVVAMPPARINLTGVALFVASGLLASTLGRLANLISVDRMGVAVSSTIIGSNPLFSTVFAVLFIGERVVPSTLAGTVLIVVGIALASWRGEGGPRLNSTLVFPFAAAALYGASSVVRKVALNILPEVTLGALVSTAASLLSFVVYLVATQGFGTVRLSRSSGKYFLVSGVIVSVAWLSMFTALSVGGVAVVSALIGTSPLFSLVLSALLLRDTEELGRGVIMGSVAIVAGAAVITLL
jgi:drug/metabolite transporter (DMT)-like permease